MTAAPPDNPAPESKSRPNPQAKPASLPAFAYLLAALPPLFWSGNFLVARMMTHTIPPIQMSFWRWCMAFVILLPFAARHLPAYLPRLRKELPFLVLLGAVGITAFNCFIYSALHHTTVVNAALINTLMPVATFVFAAIILGETLNLRQMAGVAVAISGAALIIVRGDFTNLGDVRLNVGDLLVVGGLTFWALYTVLIRWRRTGLPLTLFLTTTIGFGVLFHLPLVAWEYSDVGGFDVTWKTIAALIYVAVFPSALAYIFWNRAVGLLGPGRTGMFMYLMPVFSTALGVTFLAEPFRAYHAGGIALIFAGIYLVTRKRAKG